MAKCKYNHIQIRPPKGANSLYTLICPDLIISYHVEWIWHFQNLALGGTLLLWYSSQNDSCLERERLSDRWLNQLFFSACCCNVRTCWLLMGAKFALLLCSLWPDFLCFMILRTNQNAIKVINDLFRNTAKWWFICQYKH